MEISSTPQGTGYTEAQATDAFAQLLDREDGVQGEESETGKETPQPEDEPADEAEEAPESDDAEEGDPDPEEQPRYTVKIDGADVEVTLDEALKGYQRTADYTRKSQALAEERKAFQASQAPMAAERARVTELLGVLEQSLQAAQTPQEDLEALRYTDPAEFAAKVAENMQRQQAAQAATAERQRLEAQTAQEADNERKTQVQAEQAKLLQSIPEWADPSKAEAGVKKLTAYAKSLGFTDDDLNGLSDHRFFLVLRDAAEFRALKAKSSEIRPKAPVIKPVVPGARRAPTSDVTRAKQRLAKTGREQDAAAAFMHLIPD